MIAENVHVVRRFVGHRIGTGGRATLDALEPGDGAVVRADGETVAAFRDDDGPCGASRPRAPSSAAW